MRWSLGEGHIPYRYVDSCTRFSSHALSVRGLHASIADIPEAALVGQLVADPHWREAIFSIRGIPDSPRVLQMVDLASAPGGFVGDADIILVTPDQPSAATAIEVKRIKVGASGFDSGTPNRLREYDKAVAQANRLGQVGFAQVYLYVIAVVDSRQRNDGRYTYDGLTPNWME